MHNFFIQKAKKKLLKCTWEYICKQRSYTPVNHVKAPVTSVFFVATAQCAERWKVLFFKVLHIPMKSMLFNRTGPNV